MTDEMCTPRLVMRRWRPEDRSPFAEINADPEVMRFFPSTLDRQQSDALGDRMEEHFLEHGYGLWALDRQDQLIGFAGLSWVTWPASFTPALEVGWRLARSAWGYGYASEAGTAALARGFEEVATIVSFTAATNTASERVMKRIGMRHVCDFDHPLLPSAHPLQRHVLYQADRETWEPLPLH